MSWKVTSLILAMTLPLLRELFVLFGIAGLFAADVG